MHSFLFQDLRYALRSLKKRPGFFAVVVLTLALGIGSNVIVFTVFNTLLLRTLPYPEAERLVRVGTLWKDSGFSTFSFPEYLDLRRQNQIFEELAVYQGDSLNLASGRGNPVEVSGVDVTPSFFRVLGVNPVRGGLFPNGAGEGAGEHFALIGYSLWQQRFGGDPGIVGGQIQINSQSYTVTGVMPRGFRFPDRETEIWLPMKVSTSGFMGMRGARNFPLLARVRKDISWSRVQSDLDTIAARFRRDYPKNYPKDSGWGMQAVRLREMYVAHLRPALLMLMGAVAFVLLIACANVTNLVLARSSGRVREMAVRVALGAGRWRLVRLFFAEGLVLCVAATALGTLFAFWTMGTLTWFAPSSLVELGGVQMDASVLVFTLLIGVFTTFLVGVLPAFRVSRTGSQEALRSVITHQPANTRLRKLLVTGEVAAALVLLFGAMLMLESLKNLLEVAPGFETRNIVTARTTPDATKYPKAGPIVDFYRKVVERLNDRPGVTSAGGVSLLPLSGQNSRWSLGIEGYTPPAAGLEPMGDARLVLPGYFRSLGIRLFEGRAFDWRDAPANPKVVIVSRSFARKYWGAEDPLGKRIQLWSLSESAPWWTVVGVVGDVHHSGLKSDTQPSIYFPYTQLTMVRTMTLVVRGRSATSALAGLIREEVERVDANQPIFDVKTMSRYVSDSVSQPRFTLVLLAAFALLAVSLAVIGIYGVMGSMVAERTREIGIRMALGAQPGQVVAKLLREGLALSLGGVFLGVAFSFALKGAIQGLLFRVSPTDPVILGLVVILLLGAGLAGCITPVRKASRVDPIETLRYE